MSDGGFDPCECIFSHEMAMQQLLSILRSSQSYCTDTQCFTEMPGPQSARPEGPMGYLMMGVLWMVVMFVLFIYRPASLRNRGDGKPSNNQGHRGSPPSAPTQ